MFKILHINCACTGSTGKIICDIADYAARTGCENVLCAPCVPGENPNIRYYRTSLPYEQGFLSRMNRFYGFQYGFSPISTVRIKRIIRKEKPALIHIHCINGYMVNVYSLLRYIGKHRIPVVITNHAEFFYTGGCPHAYDCQRWLTGCGMCPQRGLATGTRYWDTSAAGWRRMKKAFSRLDRAVMVSVSPWVQERATQSPITAAMTHRMVLNGINTDIFRGQDRNLLREKYGFSPEVQIVFHPTANFSDSVEDRKGGRYVIELARRLIGQDVLVIVAGRYTQNLQVPENMVLLGQISNQQKLAEYYAMADVTVVTGKRETFNMPVAESLCCGTPVAGFLAGGPESIAIEKYSRFAEYGDVEQLLIGIQALLSQYHDSQEIVACARAKYTADVMAEGYMRLYRELLSKGVGQSDEQ